MEKKQKVMASSLENHIYNVLYNNSDRFRNYGMDQQGELCIEVARELINHLDDKILFTTATVIEEKMMFDAIPNPTNWKKIEIRKLPRVVIQDHNNAQQIVGLVRVALEAGGQKEAADDFTQRAMYQGRTYVIEIANEYADIITM